MPRNGECGHDVDVTKRYFVVKGGPKFGQDELGTSVRRITLELDRSCAGKQTSQVIDFAFQPGEKFDPARSDLDGDGIADGEERTA